MLQRKTTTLLHKPAACELLPLFMSLKGNCIVLTQHAKRLPLHAELRVADETRRKAKILVFADDAVTEPIRELANAVSRHPPQ